MAHEYSGLFMYASEELSRLKRIFLLYAKALLLIFICALFYIPVRQRVEVVEGQSECGVVGGICDGSRGGGKCGDLFAALSDEIQHRPVTLRSKLVDG
jgi:hypothetical protein